MGTSANLLVVSGANRVVQHSSYDCHIENVFATIGASVAACGVKKLREAVAGAQVLNEDEDFEDGEAELSSEALAQAFEGFFSACIGRGREPWGLEMAQSDPMYADFSHAGVVTYFAPQLIDQPGWGAPEECDFVLDLNAGTLSAQMDDQRCTLDLHQLEGKDPSDWYAKARELDLDWESLEEAEALLTQALSSAANATCSQPLSMDTISSWNLPAPHPRAQDAGPGSHEPFMAELAFHPQQPFFPRVVGAFFRQCGAMFDRDEAMYAHISEEHGARLIIDFSKGFSNPNEGAFALECVSRTAEVLHGQLGAHFTLQSQHSVTRRGGGGSIVSVGGNSLDLFGDGSGKPAVEVPEGAIKLRSHQQILESLPGVLAGDPAVARAEKAFAYSVLDHQALTLLEGVEAGEEVKLASALVKVFSDAEAAATGRDEQWAARFGLLSEGMQRELLQGMGDSDRYFTLKRLESVSEASAPARKPSL